MQIKDKIIIAILGLITLSSFNIGGSTNSEKFASIIGMVIGWSVAVFVLYSLIKFLAKRFFTDDRKPLFLEISLAIYLLIFLINK